jgi:hypothetical protein
MIRSFQWDLARQVERLDWLIAQLPRYADWGYQQVHLHLEDAVEYPSVPGVARADAYTYREFEQLVAAATRAGIQVVPIVNLLGHTQYLIKVPELRELNELRAEDGSPLNRGQICPLHPRTLEVAELLLHDVAPFCTGGRVHVGLDESFHLGKHPLSRAEAERIGLAGHFAGHVNRLHALTTKLGLKMGLWADMLYFLPDVIPLLPAGITAYEWYYYPFTRLPRVELFNFAEVDLATPLRARGIQLYGCPMNGAFRFEPLPHFGDRLANVRSWWDHSRRIAAAGFLVSSWEPYRLAIELTTALDAAAATLWLEPEVTEPREMLARGFARASGRPGVPIGRRTARRGNDSAALALAADRFPYSGYARWEINDRWDTISRRAPLDALREEARSLAHIADEAAASRAAAPLVVSLEFRALLAQRELILRQLARVADQPRSPFAVSLGRRLVRVLRRARQAARQMWSRTRDPQTTGPNEQMIEGDLARLAAWRRGEPVFGPPWQLCYDVHNVAPAVQLVGVEQQVADGSWQVVQSCHTIEFQSRAASPRGAIVREHAAPVAWDGAPDRRPVLRLFLRGAGEVRVGRIALLRGAETAPGYGVPGWVRLGEPPPRQGWPELDWGRNTAELALPTARKKARVAPGPEGMDEPDRSR